jgi:hypothetical protein
MEVKRPPKISNVMNIVHRCLREGRYLDTRHAFERQQERLISRIEIIQVLKRGYHEKRKDNFEETFRSWNYAIRGKTVDGRELRIIVTLDQNNMLIITAINLC